VGAAESWVDRPARDLTPAEYVTSVTRPSRLPGSTRCRGEARLSSGPARALRVTVFLTTERNRDGRDLTIGDPSNSAVELNRRTTPGTSALTSVEHF